MPKGVFQHKPQQGFQKGNKLGNKFKKGNIPWQEGKPWTEKQKERLKQTWREKRKKRYSEAGKKRWRENSERFSECGFKKGNIPWNKGIKLGKGFYPNRDISYLKKYQFQSGENHHNWKGGRVQRKKHEGGIYLRWTRKVYRYDNYTCWICEKRGGKLAVHHLKGWSEYPKLRYKISNGLTLCEFCHKTYTKFVKKARKKWEQKKSQNQ